MKKILILYFVFFFDILLTNNIHAYIDPSAVTYTAQIFAAVMIAIGSAFTIFRHKIVSLFKGKKKAKREIHVYGDIFED